MAYNIDQILQNEANRIGPDIYQKKLNSSPWLKLVEKDSWPDEMGEEISVMVYERSLPTTSQSWSTISFNTGTGNNCVPTASVVNVAQTLRTYNLQQSALESPPLCVNDLRFSLKRKEQLGNVFDILAQNTAWSWQERHRDEYVRLAEHKVILRASYPESAASFPLQTPQYAMTQGVLDRYALKLMRDGAGDTAFGRQNNVPQFAAIMSPETHELIIRENSNIRQDFRDSTRVNELLGPLGVETSYKGWYHIVDLFPPRYDFVGGAWVKREPYTAVATTQGNKYDVNPTWETAEYEDTILFHPKVFTSLIPKPISAPGGNTKFNPQTAMGDFKWLNIPDRTLNPDGTIGYFRAVFSSGSKPVHPEWGYVIRHKRCIPNPGLADCVAT